MEGRVLVISRYFPPGGGVGAFRAAKFVKYLPKFGWEPYVVSLPPERQNAFLPNEIDKDQYSEVTDMIETRIYIDVLLPHINRSMGDIRRLPLLAQKIPYIVEENDIDVIYHTAPPFYSLPSVSWVSRKVDVPYIIDFRDPWYINENIFNNTKSNSNKIWSVINRILERKTVNNSDKITTATNKMKSMYTEEYPNKRNKFIAINNGYDPSDYEVDCEVEKDSSQFHIIYPGKFRDNTQYLVESIKEAQNKHDILLTHLGDKTHEYAEKFYLQAEDAGIGRSIHKEGYMDFEKVVAHIKESDVGLIITRKNDPTHVPQKTFDYIACGIPILAITQEESELSRILQPFDYAYLASHDDKEKIVDNLIDMITKHPDSLGTDEELQKYTRERMTEKLSEVFKGAVRNE